MIADGDQFGSRRFSCLYCSLQEEKGHIDDGNTIQTIIIILLLFRVSSVSAQPPLLSGQFQTPAITFFGLWPTFFKPTPSDDNNNNISSVICLTAQLTSMPARVPNTPSSFVPGELNIRRHRRGRGRRSCYIFFVQFTNWRVVRWISERNDEKCRPFFLCM